MFLVGLFLSLGQRWRRQRLAETVVSSEDGLPVVGASILVAGTQMGTVTDIDGKFHLIVPAGKNQLRVQYVGLKNSARTSLRRYKGGNET